MSMFCVENHRVLSIKEISQLDLITSRFIARKIEMWHLDKLVADLDVEIAFCYGAFGFGYSNVYLTRGMTRPSKEQVYCTRQHT